MVDAWQIQGNCASETIFLVEAETFYRRAAWLCQDEPVAASDYHAAVELLDKLGAAYDLARARLLLAAAI